MGEELALGLGSQALGGLISLIGAGGRPKYQIQPEVTQNQTLGAQAAFGKNPGITQGEQMADQTAAQDVNTAQQYSSNAGTILNTLKAINNNRNQTKQGLAIADANQRTAGRGQLMNANSQAIDEADKAWNYNVNQPYQNRVAAVRDFTKGSTENFWKMLDYSRAAKLLKDNSQSSLSTGIPSYGFSGSFDYNDNGNASTDEMNS